MLLRRLGIRASTSTCVAVVCIATCMPAMASGPAIVDTFDGSDGLYHRRRSICAQR